MRLCVELVSDERRVALAHGAVEACDIKSVEAGLTGLHPLAAPSSQPRRASQARRACELSPRNRCQLVADGDDAEASGPRVVKRSPTRSPVRAHSSRLPARPTGGVGVLADEFALVAGGLDRRSTWPSPAARVLIGVAGSVRVNPAFACEGRVALGHRRSGVAFVRTVEGGLLLRGGAVIGSELIEVRRSARVRAVWRSTGGRAQSG